MSPLRISAIVPYFEAHKTIQSALRSLVEGELAPDEIILVNDGSSIESRSELEEVVVELDSPTIKIVDHQHNLGGGFARNTAVLQSKNAWIFCLDADNLAPKNLLKNLARFIEENPGSMDVVSPERVIFFEDRTLTVSHAWTFRNSNLPVERYVKTSVLPGSSGNYLFSKDSWYKSGGYPTSARSLDAWGFGLRLHLAGYHAQVAPGTHYFHRIGIPSYYVRESKNPKALSLVATAQMLENSSRIPERVVKDLLHRRRAKSWFSEVEGALQYNDSRLTSDVGFTTPREALDRTELDYLEQTLKSLDHL